MGGAECRPLLYPDIVAVPTRRGRLHSRGLRRQVVVLHAPAGRSGRGATFGRTGRDVRIGRLRRFRQPRLRHRHARPACDADRRREPRIGHGLFVGLDRAAQRYPAATSHAKYRRSLRDVRHLCGSLRLGRGYGLSDDRADLPFGAVALRDGDEPGRRDVDPDGKVRCALFTGAGRAPPRHPRPLGADHAGATAQAPARSARRLTICRASAP